MGKHVQCGKNMCAGVCALYMEYLSGPNCPSCWLDIWEIDRKCYRSCYGDWPVNSGIFIHFIHVIYFPSPCLVAGLCALQNALQAPCCTRIACPWSHRGWRHWTLMVLKVLSGCWQLAVVLRAHNFTSLPHWIHSQAAVLPWAEKLERSHQNSGAQWSCAVLCQENIDQPGGMALVESKAHWTVLAFKGGSASNTHKSCRIQPRHMKFPGVEYPFIMVTNLRTTFFPDRNYRVYIYIHIYI